MFGFVPILFRSITNTPLFVKSDNGELMCFVSVNLNSGYAD